MSEARADGDPGPKASDGEPRSAGRATPRAGHNRPASAAGAWAAAAAAVALNAAVCWHVCQPSRAGGRSMLVLFGVTQLGLAAAAVTWLRRRGLLARLAPVRGDITLGFALALVLYGVGWGLTRMLVSTGEPARIWLMRIYLQVGDPVMLTALPIGLAVMLIGACEEVVWRGGVMTALTDAHGSARAWWLTALLQTLGYAPSLMLLRDIELGPNPLLVGGTFVVALVWGALVHKGVRLAPICVSHALLAWALVEWRLWQP